MDRFHLAFILVVALCPSIFGQPSGKKYYKYPASTSNLLDEIKKIEKEQGLNFFYLGDWLSGIPVHPSTRVESITRFLQNHLEGTQMSFFPTGENSIVLYKNPTYDKMIDRVEARSVNDNHVSTIGDRTLFKPGDTVTLSGRIRNATKDAFLQGASVNLKDSEINVNTDQYGNYSMDILSGEHTVEISYVGLNKEEREILILSDGNLDVDLFEDPIQLEIITIEGDMMESAIDGLIPGKTSFNLNLIKKTPALLGRPDLMNSISRLPGVADTGEGSSGFNVRGGAPDQNLVLVDDVPVFNVSHLFGFFSTFSADVLQRAELYKGGIPANYGGRASSVLDISLKTGNDEKFKAGGSAGPIDASFNMEGPLKKGQTSYSVGGRLSYIDWLLKKYKNTDVRHSTAGFYDTSIKVSHKFSDRDVLSFSAYRSYDSFRFALDTTYSWETTLFSGKYQHSFRNNLHVSLTAYTSAYKFNTASNKIYHDFRLDNRIDYQGIKSTIYYSVARHNLQTGLSLISYDFSIGQLRPTSNTSNVTRISPEPEESSETHVFINDEYVVNDAISLMAGINFSIYKRKGPNHIYVYREGAQRVEENIIDTVFYNEKSTIADYMGFEPRFSIKYNLSQNTNIKIGYGNMNQYLHQLSNTAGITPVDIWKPSNGYIRPIRSRLLSLGIFSRAGKGIAGSFEVFYKKLDNVIDYKEGASILLNETLEADIVAGNSRAYGAEIYLERTTDRLSSSLSYTYSRSERIMNGAHPDEIINDGKYYPSNFDRPHNLNLLSNFKFSRRWNISANFQYLSGRPFTAPSSKYKIESFLITDFTQRNSDRLPDYHRLDVSITLETNLKKKKPWESSWIFSLFNVYGRKNIYSVFYTKASDLSISAKKVSILGTIFPSVTYNFKI